MQNSLFSPANGKIRYRISGFLSLFLVLLFLFSAGCATWRPGLNNPFRPGKSRQYREDKARNKLPEAPLFTGSALDGEEDDLSSLDDSTIYSRNSSDPFAALEGRGKTTKAEKKPWWSRMYYSDRGEEINNRFGK